MVRMRTLVPSLRLMIWRVASMPFSSGRAMSMTTTFGWMRCASSVAVRPSPASPTISISSSDSRSRRRPCRTTVWSSTKRTLIFPMMLAFPAASHHGWLVSRWQRFPPLLVPCQGLFRCRPLAGLPPPLALRQPPGELLGPRLVMPQRGDLLYHGGEPAVGSAARRLELLGMSAALGLERRREARDLTFELLHGARRRRRTGGLPRRLGRWTTGRHVSTAPARRVLVERQHEQPALVQGREHRARRVTLADRPGPGAGTERVQPSIEQRVGDRAMHHVDGVSAHAVREDEELPVAEVAAQHEH